MEEARKERESESPTKKATEKPTEKAITLFNNNNNNNNKNYISFIKINFYFVKTFIFFFQKNL